MKAELMRSVTLAGLAVALQPVTASAEVVGGLDVTPFLEALAPYQELPAFRAAGEPFDAQACMADKTIFSIPVSSENTFTAAIELEMKAIADRIGFDFVIWENQGTPQQWAQGITAAINQGADLIDMLAGADPRTVVPQVMQARDAGIPVIASHNSAIEQREEMLRYADGDAVVDYRTVGNILGNWAVAKRGGELNALVLVASGPLATEVLEAGVLESLENCETCQSQVIDVPPQDWSTRLTSTVQSTLTANPDINYIIAIYDGMTQFIAPGVVLADAEDRVLVSGFNGTPGAISLIQEGRVDMTVGENLNWIAHAILDANMRRVCGLEPVNDPFIPFYIFDETNADTAGTPPQLSQGYGDAYVAGYADLWMLND